MPLKTPSLENTLETQLTGGRAVRDLRIHVTRRIPDLLVTLLTAGIVSPVSVRFTGIIGTQAP